jgi:hypothetical protein
LNKFSRIICSPVAAPILDVSGTLTKRDQLHVLFFRDDNSVFSGHLVQSLTPITGQSGVSLRQNGSQKNFQAVFKCIS